uniref:Uncharacterized protein n=1 Tax=Rhizophora mucronata TaxID=61149 RepID=A0A2P2QVS1_RHIMU
MQSSVIKVPKGQKIQNEEDRT